MRQLNGTAAAVLGYLTQGPHSGYEVAKGLDDMVGDFWNVTTSQIYRELANLADAGLVEAGPVGARDRRPYSLTDTGRRALETWLAEAPGSDVVRIPLLLKLFMLFSVGEPDEAQLARLVGSYRAAHASQLAGYEAKLAELEAAGLPFIHLVRYGLLYERAVLEWIDGLPWKPPDTRS